MTLEDCYGLLFLGYFALIFGVGVGVYARGATWLAALLVMALGAVFVTLLCVAIAAAALEPRRA
ncbi:MAG TPA: hypothetical protein VID72_11790 [Ktedonobacterales bacterium]|jgi:hypothetical protein